MPFSVLPRRLRPLTSRPARVSAGPALRTARCATASRALALILCAGLLHARAHADETVRPEVAQALQAAQAALSARHPDESLQLLEPLRGPTALSPNEQRLVAQVTAAAALQARRFSVAAEALERLLQAPDLSIDERRPYVQSLVNAYVNLKNYPKVASWAQAGMQLGPRDVARFRAVRWQALNLQGDDATVVAEGRPALATISASPLTEAELRALGASQLKLKDGAGYYQTLWALVKLSPRKDYWADLLARVPQQPGFSERMSLDVYRLYETTENLEDASDYLEMARLALKAGLPAEALRVLTLGVSRQVLTDATAQAPLREARQRAAEDEKSLGKLRAEARDGESWAALADLYASASQWGPAAEAYDRALSFPGLKRRDEVQLHYGRCLYQSGQKDAARAAFGKAGDAAAPVAQLWLALLGPAS